VPDLYTPHRDTIEAALAYACRTHRLGSDAADEFRSWARVRLLDNDQAVLRKFQGRSTLRTYLVTVVQRLYLDWRNAEWGKWRPSAEARRLGHLAVELERLVLRDDLPLVEAAQTLVARGLASAGQCEALWTRLPQRPQRRRISEARLAALPGAARATDEVDDAERRAEATRVAAALDRALLALPPADRVLLQLRYWSGVTVARIALLTGEPQRALYRRYDRLTAELRRQLEAQGVSATALADVIGRIDAPDRPEDDLAAALGIRGSRPSHLPKPGGDHD
jgi:RNA polymerase sigma factor (sigma-70 family)